MVSPGGCRIWSLSFLLVRQCPALWHMDLYNVGTSFIKFSNRVFLQGGCHNPTGDNNKNATPFFSDILCFKFQFLATVTQRLTTQLHGTSGSGDNRPTLASASYTTIYLMIWCCFPSMIPILFGSNSIHLVRNCLVLRSVVKSLLPFMEPSAASQGLDLPSLSTSVNHSFIPSHLSIHKCLLRTYYVVLCHTDYEVR